MKNSLKELIGADEKILYEGKPNKKCFIFESIFNKSLPFAILWALFDFGFIRNAVTENSTFLIPFMLFHLMPVWMYLYGVAFSFRRHKNTNYIVTDQAIYVSGGVFTQIFNRKSFAELSQINLHRNIFDQLFNVGDIIATSNQLTKNNASAAITIASVFDYVEIYNLIKKLQTDIYTDIMYPNDKRPSGNHGYNTEYKG